MERAKDERKEGGWVGEGERTGGGKGRKSGRDGGGGREIKR